MKKEQIIFLHIPKTAGTTLRSIIYGQYGESKVAPIYPEKPYIELKEFNQLAAARKDQADAIIGHFGYGFHKQLSGNRPCRYATMLRNPISLCLSLYNHLKNMQYAGSDISFKELLKGQYGAQFNNFQFFLISGRNRLEVERSPVGLLETAMNHIERDFAFVGITERFNESLFLASHNLGWELRPYERRNVSSKQWVHNYVEELRDDKESMDLLMELNEIDMQFYDYFNKRLTENLSELYPDLQDRLAKFEAIIASPQTDVPKAVGNLGVLQKQRIHGWAKLLNKDRTAQVGIIINRGREFVVNADIQREDLVHLHYTGSCGFVLELPKGSLLKPGDEVSARIINAKGVSLQESPRIFTDM